MSPGIDIRLQPVLRAGDDLAAIAEDAHKHIDIELGRSNSAVEGLAGFESASALSTCTSTWKTHLAQLIDDTLSAAEKLRESATDYANLELRITSALDAMDTGE
jgi:hypothetical protein